MTCSRTCSLVVCVVLWCCDAIVLNAQDKVGLSTGRATDSQNAPSVRPQPVILLHDAAIDDFIATLLVETMPDVDVKGIVIVNADCIGGPAIHAAFKLQGFIKRPEVPLGLSKARGWNAFPWKYRGDCLRFASINSLAVLPANPNWPAYPEPIPDPTKPPTAAAIDSREYPSGGQLLERLLTEAVKTKEPVILLVESPVTPLVSLLQANPGLAQGVGEVIVMAGSVNGAKGNLEPENVPKEIANAYAEWNVFWDPWSLDWLLRHARFPVTLFPLNVTNQAAIAPAFKAELARQATHFPFSRLALDGYELVKDQKFYEMWNVVPACYLTRRDLFDAPQEMRLSVITEGFYQGALVADPGAPQTIKVILNLSKPNEFYSYVLHQLQR